MNTKFLILVSILGLGCDRPADAGAASDEPQPVPGPVELTPDDAHFATWDHAELSAAEQNRAYEIKMTRRDRTPRQILGAARAVGQVVLGLDTPPRLKDDARRTAMEWTKAELVSREPAQLFADYPGVWISYQRASETLRVADMRAVRKSDLDATGEQTLQTERVLAGARDCVRRLESVGLISEGMYDLEPLHVGVRRTGRVGQERETAKNFSFTAMLGGFAVLSTQLEVGVGGDSKCNDVSISGIGVEVVGTVPLAISGDQAAESFKQIAFAEASEWAHSVVIERAFVGYQLAPQLREAKIGPMYVADYLYRREMRGGERLGGTMGYWGAISLTDPDAGLQPFEAVKSDRTEW